LVATFKLAHDERERGRGTREYLKQFKGILASKADGKKS